MGYLIARAMRTYAMSYQEVMSMPCRAFWTISGYVERLRADEAKLNLEIAASSQASDAAASMFERLEKQAPAPVVYTGYALANVGAELDSDGLNDLRALAG